MDWAATFGLALLFGLVGVFGIVLSGLWVEEIVRERSEVYERGSLEARLQDGVRRRRIRLKQWALGCGWVLLLVSIFLLTRSPNPVSSPQPVQIVVAPPFGVSTTPGSPPVEWLWPLSTLVSLLLISGTVLLVRGPVWWARVAGLVTITAGLVAHYHLVDKVEIGTIFAFASKSKIQTQNRAEIEAKMAEIKPKIVNELRVEIESLIGKMQVSSDKVELRAEIETYIRKMGSLGPENLGQFTGFEPGSPELTPDMEKTASEICDRWQKRNKHQIGFLLAVGATDRVPLGAWARLRFESNFGLARARAERVKSKIVDCGVSSSRVLALVSGPRTTPERTIRPAADTGFADDRSVNVWAVWGWQDSP